MLKSNNPLRGADTLEAKLSAVIALRRLPAWAMMLPALTIACVLLGVRLGSKDLWYDEAYSVAFARLRWDAFVTAIQHIDGSFTLYYGLLHLWLRLGDNITVVRGLSAIFALATIPVMFELARAMLGMRVAICASLLLACNTFFITYGQEARSYSLLLLMSTVATLFFVRSARIPSRRNLAFYVGSMVLALYAHPYAVLTLGAHTLSLGLPTYRRSARPIALAISVVCLACIPLAVLLARDGPGQISWLPHPGAELLGALYSSLAGNRVMLVLYSALIVVAILRTRRAAPSERDAFVALLIWSFVPVIVIFAASYVKPLFFVRYLIATLTPLIILVAVGIAALRPRALFVVFSLALVFGSVLSLRGHYRDGYKLGWRSTVDAIIADRTPGRGVVVFPETAIFPFEFAEHERGIPPNAQLAFPNERFPMWADKVTAAPLPPRRLSQIVHAYPDLWVIATNPQGVAFLKDAADACRQANDLVDQQPHPSVIVIHCHSERSERR